MHRYLWSPMLLVIWSRFLVESNSIIYNFCLYLEKNINGLAFWVFRLYLTVQRDKKYLDKGRYDLQQRSLDLELNCGHCSCVVCSARLCPERAVGMKPQGPTRYRWIWKSVKKKINMQTHMVFSAYASRHHTSCLRAHTHTHKHAIRL